MKFRLLLLFLPLFCCSCFLSKRHRVESLWDGPQEFIFKEHFLESPYLNMPGELRTGNAASYTYYELGGVRTYCKRDSFCTDKPADEILLSAYSGLFEKRLLNGSMFFCFSKTEKPCKPYADSLATVQSDSIVMVPQPYYGYLGPCVIVLSVRSLDEQLHSPDNLRRLEIRVGHPSVNVDVFYMELENKLAKHNSSLNDFISGATLTYFKYQYSEI